MMERSLLIWVVAILSSLVSLVLQPPALLLSQNGGHTIHLPLIVKSPLTPPWTPSPTVNITSTLVAVPTLAATLTSTATQTPSSTPTDTSTRSTNTPTTIATATLLPPSSTATNTATAINTPTPTQTATTTPTGLNPNPPASPVKLVFVHHSTGGMWLPDDYGQLGQTLAINNYYVSDTNYGWGPGGIGDTTDIGHWHNWFGSGRSTEALNALYTYNDTMSGYYTRLSDPGGENEIIMFKSCFPNSALQGEPDQSPPAIGNNPLRGQDAASVYHTVANAKGIYLDLLPYFQSQPDKLFVVITAPPLQNGTFAANARIFNEWLVNDWLDNYPLNNVAVFDYYNVLTTNGGDADTNDLNAATGNHHRYRNGIIEHTTTGDNDSNPNVLEYPSGAYDDHPSPAGDRKATAEFVTLLNIFYHRWKP